MIKLIINKAGESRLTVGAQGFTGVPKFTVNEEGPINNIINTNLASLDSQAGPKPSKLLSVISEEA